MVEFTLMRCLYTNINHTIGMYIVGIKDTTFNKALFILNGYYNAFTGPHSTKWSQHRVRLVLLLIRVSLGLEILRFTAGQGLHSCLSFGNEGYGYTAVVLPSPITYQDKLFRQIMFNFRYLVQH